MKNNFEYKRSIFRLKSGYFYPAEHIVLRITVNFQFSPPDTTLSDAGTICRWTKWLSWMLQRIIIKFAPILIQVLNINAGQSNEN